MAERHTVDVDVVGSRPIRLPMMGQMISLPICFFIYNHGCEFIFMNEGCLVNPTFLQPRRSNPEYTC